MSTEKTPEEVVAEAKSEVAAEDEKKLQAKAGGMKEVPPSTREVCASIARWLIDPRHNKKALVQCVGSIVAARQLYAMAVRDLELRLEAFTEQERQLIFEAAIEDICNGDLLDQRLERWFPEDVETEPHVLEHEREMYEQINEEAFGAPDRDDAESYKIAREKLAEALRQEFAEVEPATSWSLMQEVCLQAGMYQASKPFSEKDLFRGMEETVLPWMGEVVKDHIKADKDEQERDLEEYEKARRARPVPIGLRISSEESKPELPRDRPLVITGWAPAVQQVLDVIATRTLAAKKDQLFCVIRLATLFDDNDVTYRTQQRRFVWLGSKTWEDCTRSNTSWPILFEKMLLRRMAEPPDLLICDDLALAGKSAGLVGGVAARKAGHAQKKLFDWCKKVGCAFVGGVPFVDKSPAELANLHNGGEWAQLRDFTTLRAITVHEKDNDYRLELGRGVDHVTVSKERLDANAPGRIIIST